jgi:hypothetical protein
MTYPEGWPQTIYGGGDHIEHDIQVVPLSHAERLREELERVKDRNRAYRNRNTRLREALLVIANYAVSEKDRNLARAALDREGETAEQFHARHADSPRRTSDGMSTGCPICDRDQALDREGEGEELRQLGVPYTDDLDREGEE